MNVVWTLVEFNTNMLGRNRTDNGENLDREFCVDPKPESKSPFHVFGSNRPRNPCCGGRADGGVDPGEYWFFAEATGTLSGSPVVCQSVITINLSS